MVTTITVQPGDKGWIVGAPNLKPQTFSSGAAAEAAARQMAEHRFEKGQATEIRIHLRNGALAARFICAPEYPSQVIWEPSVVFGATPEMTQRESA